MTFDEIKEICEEVENEYKTKEELKNIEDIIKLFHIEVDHLLNTILKLRKENEELEVKYKESNLSSTYWKDKALGLIACEEHTESHVGEMVDCPFCVADKLGIEVKKYKACYDNIEKVIYFLEDCIKQKE